MSAWIIEPREPLIVRDGRPFQRQPGVIAASLPFPFPSTTAGAARSRAGSENGVFNVAANDLLALKSLQVRGPLLVAFDEKEEGKLLVPAPGDALLLEQDNYLCCRRLVPLKQPENAWVQPFRDDGNYGYQLCPVGLPSYEPAKPAKGQPAFWYWQKFENWLLRPEQMDGQIFARDDLGIQALPEEQRIHVSLERGMMVAQEGALFETRGREFTMHSGEGATLSGARRLALWLDVERHETYRIQEGLDSLGAERRLVSWRKSPEDAEDVWKNVQKCPDALQEQIIKQPFCRLILLTPAYFQQGYLPNVARLELAGVKLTLQAALVQRPQVVSGWDMNKSRIKPTRRLVPAGSVFFLKLKGQPDDIRAWIEHTWMQCISEPDRDQSDNQNKRDGFGLAVLGSWSGELMPLGE